MMNAVVSMKCPKGCDVGYVTAYVNKEDDIRMCCTACAFDFKWRTDGKIAVVDIDCTLWDFHKEWQDEFEKRHGEFIQEGEWNWDVWNCSNMSKEQFFDIVKYIHQRQHLGVPYDGAFYLLNILKQMGYYIIIASHRDPNTIPLVENFLDNNSLVYDEIDLSDDKTPLFEIADLVVDDAPFLIEKAIELNVPVVGLLFPWNEKLRDDAPLFDNLIDLTFYLKENIKC